MNPEIDTRDVATLHAMVSQGRLFRSAAQRVPVQSRIDEIVASIETDLAKGRFVVPPCPIVLAQHDRNLFSLVDGQHSLEAYAFVAKKHKLRISVTVATYLVGVDESHLFKVINDRTPADHAGADHTIVATTAMLLCENFAKPFLTTSKRPAKHYGKVRQDELNRLLAEMLAKLRLRSIAPVNSSELAKEFMGHNAVVRQYVHKVMGTSTRCRDGFAVGFLGRSQGRLLSTILYNTTYPMKVAFGPAIRTRFSDKFATRLWRTYYGALGELNCPVCATSLMDRGDRTTWHVSHVQARARGGANGFDNCRPVCAFCNRAMGVCGMREWILAKYPSRASAALRRLKL